MNLRGVYGEHFNVTARRWWSRKDRREARLAARIADYVFEQSREEYERIIIRSLIYGDTFGWGEGEHGD